MAARRSGHYFALFYGIRNYVTMVEVEVRLSLSGTKVVGHGNGDILEGYLSTRTRQQKSICAALRGNHSNS